VLSVLWEWGRRGIFFKRKDAELAWFDLRTQMIEELCYNGGSRFGWIIIYMENILPVGGASN